MDRALDRPVYRPSGLWDVARFPATLALMAACAGGIAALYCLQIFINVYVSGLSVMFPAIVIGVSIRWVVKYGHWRNPLLAGALGMTTGLVGYLGYFHADQCLRWSVPWSAVNRLPEYVVFRMETDRWEQAGKGALLRPRPAAVGVSPRLPPAQAKLQSWNWAGFVFETLVLMLAPLLVGVAASREPYSERQRRWFLRERLTLAPYSAKTLRQSLANDTVARWIDGRPKKVASHQAHETVMLWYTPAEQGEEADTDVFVSIGRQRPVQLRPEEAAAFASLLPSVQDLAGPMLSQLSAEAEESFAADSARVWPVPPPYAGQVVNPGNRVRWAVLCWSLFLVPLLLAALLPGGVHLLDHFAVPAKLVPAWVVPVFVTVYGLLCIAFVLWWYNPNAMIPVRMGIRFEYRLMRRAVASRPDPTVAHDDPRAVFAEMCPRRFWVRNMPKCGDCNQGLMLIDTELRGIRFEGDYHCYWIPAAAIEACDVEAAIDISAAATKASFWAVVLRVRVGGGIWEFPFFPRANIEGRNRWEQAMALLQKIEQICGRDFVGQPTVPPDVPEIHS